MGGDGVLIAGGSYSVFTGLESKDNGGTGYYDRGDQNTCVNAVLSGNQLQFRQNGENSVAVNAQINGETVETLAGLTEK